MLWISAAPAWESSGSAIAPNSLPLTLAWGGEDSALNEDELRAAVEHAADEWTEQTCTALELTVVQKDEAALRTDGDGDFSIVFGDPFEELDEAIFALTVISAGGTTRWNGEQYAAVSQARMVFGGDGSFVTDEQIERGECTDQYSITGMLVSSLGNIFGLGAVCDAGEDCDVLEIESSMNRDNRAACSDAASTLAGDDRAGIQAIYGRPVIWSCPPVADDWSAVACTAEAEGATAFTWQFGDGATASGPTATHQYATAGAYRVDLCVTLEECDYEQCYQAMVYPLEAGAFSPGVDADARTPATDDCGCQGGAGAAFLPLIGGLLRWRRARPTRA